MGDLPEAKLSPGKRELVEEAMRERAPETPKVWRDKRSPTMTTKIDEIRERRTCAGCRGSGYYSGGIEGISGRCPECMGTGTNIDPVDGVVLLNHIDEQDEQIESYRQIVDSQEKRIDELERDRRKFHRRAQKAEGALAQIQNWADICRDCKPSTDIPLDQIDAILEDTDND